ncbi:hypothetical protein B296_00046224 [Ensete ventricosum]|uniref:Uncharacterized protein n=1 Tax=Ensete ventricosum TaxID=4639 RepID=A0A426YPG2_ENSVE|nr:hypothetical protein B296_00046224 [Ensete ventricosum]
MPSSLVLDEEEEPSTKVARLNKEGSSHCKSPAEQRRGVRGSTAEGRGGAAAGGAGERVTMEEASSLYQEDDRRDEAEEEEDSRICGEAAEVTIE